MHAMSPNILIYYKQLTNKKITVTDFSFLRFFKIIIRTYNYKFFFFFKYTYVLTNRKKKQYYYCYNLLKN